VWHLLTATKRADAASLLNATRGEKKKERDIKDRNRGGIKSTQSEGSLRNELKFNYLMMRGGYRERRAPEQALKEGEAKRSRFFRACLLRGKQAQLNLDIWSVSCDANGEENRIY
jgi:tRNA 2-selenouridine synthase SelU